MGRTYGMGPVTLARNLNIHRAQAQRILDQITARYPVLNAWLERVLLRAAHRAPVTCVLGWSLRGKGKAGEHTTFLNFPMQANSAELMRLIFVRSSEVRLIGCAHDSFLIEDTIERIEQAVTKMTEIIKQASRDLFGGFELRVDCNPTTDMAEISARSEHYRS